MQATIHPDWSRKMRFFSFLSMFLLVYVHGYDLNDRYLQPFTFVQEKLTFTSFFEYFTANGIFRFRIPMLFAISGFLLAMADSKSYWKMIGKRFRTLAIPYFIWSGLGLLIAYGLYQLPSMRETVFNAHLQGYDPATNSFKRFEEFGRQDWINAYFGPTPYQLWFLRSLFVLNLLYPVLRWLSLKVTSVWFVYITLLWIVTPVGLMGLGLEIAGPNSKLGQLIIHSFGPWNIFFDGEGLLPFCLGIWLYKRGKDLSAMPRWFSMPVFLSIFVVAAVAKTIMAFYGNPASPFAIGIPIWVLHKVVVASGFLVAWYGLGRLADWGLQRRWFRHISDQSFMIYALHVPLITYLIDPVHRLLQPFRYYRLTTYLLLPLAVVCFCIAVGMLLRKLAPPVFGILTGNRGLKPLPSPSAPPATGTVTFTPPLTEKPLT